MTKMDNKIEEALRDMGVASEKVNEAPAKDNGPFDELAEQKEVEAKPAKKPVEASNVGVDPAIPDASPKDRTIADKLRKFCIKTNAYYCQSPNTPQAKYFATDRAWSYLLALNNCYVEVVETWERERRVGRYDIAVDVYVKGKLMQKPMPEEFITLPQEITIGTMCASTDEQWLRGKQLSAAYGLAQTRLVERLAREIFGYQMSLARLEPTGAEELDVVEEWYGKKNEEI